LQGDGTCGELWEYPEPSSSEEVLEDNGIEDEEVEREEVHLNMSLRGPRVRGLMQQAAKLKRRKYVR
jgi:hypothetical protein